MEWFINFVVRSGQSLWAMLTKGLRIAFGWLAEGFVHFIAGGAVSGVNRVLGSAREKAKTVGVRGSSSAIGYSSGGTSSTAVAGKADAKNFMGQFI